ncbi:MAG: hypothetical protein AABY32_04445 [Nanoarchaeota archaeon]
MLNERDMVLGTVLAKFNILFMGTLLKEISKHITQEEKDQIFNNVLNHWKKSLLESLNEYVKSYSQIINTPVGKYYVSKNELGDEESIRIDSIKIVKEAEVILKKTYLELQKD